MELPGYPRKQRFTAPQLIARPKNQAPNSKAFDACRKVTTLEELQADLDDWMERYNNERTHQGRWCYGKTPMATFLDSMDLAKEKMLAA